MGIELIPNLQVLCLDGRYHLPRIQLELKWRQVYRRGEFSARFNDSAPKGPLSPEKRSFPAS